MTLVQTKASRIPMKTLAAIVEELDSDVEVEASRRVGDEQNEQWRAGTVHSEQWRAVAGALEDGEGRDDDNCEVPLCVGDPADRNGTMPHSHSQICGGTNDDGDGANSDA